MNSSVIRSVHAIAAFLVLMWTPNWAAAREFPWADGRFALPVLVAGALLPMLVGWTISRAYGRRPRASLSRRLWKTLGVVLWLALVSVVGTYAVFAESDVAKNAWQLMGYVVGFAVFLPLANRALNLIDPPSKSAQDADA